MKIALRLYYLRLQGFSYSAVTGEEKIPLCMTIKLFKLLYKIYNMIEISSSAKINLGMGT